MKRLRVGVSLFSVQGLNVWSSGVHQNIAFLVMLLKASKRVGEVYLLNGGDVDTLGADSGLAGLGVKLVKPQDVTHDIDCVIEMGAQLPVEWLRHVRALGAKIITFFVGNTYADICESPMFNRGPGQIFNGTPWHEVWTLPQYEKTCVPLLKTISRGPVFSMPHIWSPVFLERNVQALRAEGLAFGFSPQDRARQADGWRVGIFEPNISVVKNCFIPMLVTDHAYRCNKAAVGLMMVMNSFHLKEHLTFNRLASSLDLTREHRASYEPRVAFADCMTRSKLDAVVSHQWENAQNYLYYDALYGGYPLIHNSPLLKEQGMGFYYPGFEAMAGGAALLDAWTKDPEYWVSYRQSAQAFLQTVAPTHPANVEAFVDRLVHVDEVAP